jgi:hypothetical protein
MNPSDPGTTSAARRRWQDLLPLLALVGVLVVAAVLRLSGLAWDETAHLHPDERFLTMVETGLRLPASLAEYFDTARSPLNPHNSGFTFFVYGTFPIFFVRLAAGGCRSLAMTRSILWVARHRRCSTSFL